MFTTLITPTALAPHVSDPDWVVIDCRFDLTDPAKGERQYLDGHIPGARYAHLDRDLSGAKTGQNGRHPLPAPEQMIERFGAWGITPGRQVVAYDADTGMYAARLWWMLRYMGHQRVAVLDGGLARWVREGHPVREGKETSKPATFVGAPQAGWRLTAEEVEQHLGDPARLLVDARTNERYHGIGETLDKVGGHIPGAANFFWQDNLGPDKTFKTPEELKQQWRSLLADRPVDEVVMYCGSGVTACVNLLALEHAGLPGARLYAGSWSEWSQNPERPVEK
jgi:thiosulfate/3-mercaptopyruvate sulfurtransferase